MVETKNKTVSDIISTEDIDTWTPEQIIVIQAGTGQGKSYFIKHSLYDYAKTHGQKILYLIHRKRVKDQFQIELETDNKTDIIDIRTYQHIEHKIGQEDYSRTDLFDYYDYIICDEFHYFVGDSSFNGNTDISFYNIFKYDDAIRICMSATPNKMKYILKKYAEHRKLTIKAYELKSTYPCLQRLCFYDAADTPEEILKTICPEDKAIMFCGAAEAYRLHTIFPDSLFLCSQNNRYYKYVDEDAINKMLVEQRFDTKYLFATKCFDAGANLRDKAIKTIIVDMFDVSDIIQCVGRKRVIDASDSYDLYIHRHDNNVINGWKRDRQIKIGIAELYITDQSEYIKLYGRNDPSKMIYVSEKEGTATTKLNVLRYAKAQYDFKVFAKMLNEKYGYCKYLAKVFNKYNSDQDAYYYSIYDESKELQRLDEYLFMMTGGADYENNFEPRYMLEIKDRDELIKAINYRNKKGRLHRKRTVLNEYLWSIGLPYQIEQEEQDGFSAVWYVIDSNNPQEQSQAREPTLDEISKGDWLEAI